MQAGRFKHRGFTAVYGSVVLVGMIAMISLAVDWGRVQTARSEMQDAVDAAARYAAAGLTDGTTLAKAQQAALNNSIDGSTLALLAADVETGTWDTANRAFVPNGTPTNTVRVTGRRTAARGNPVPLIFGRIIGANTCDVVQRSVARQSSLAVVGIDSLTLTGSATIKRRATEGGGVTTASNGAYALGGSTSIIGDALYRTTAPSGSVTGRLQELPSDFGYAVSTVPAGASSYTTINVSSGNNPVMGNIYCSGDVYCGGTAIITLYGNTNIYLAGNATFTGNMSVVTNGYRMYLHSVGTGTITYSNVNPIPVGIYAPNSPVNISGPGVITGSVVGKTVSLSSEINYSATYPIPAKASGSVDALAGGGVLTVK